MSLSLPTMHGGTGSLSQHNPRESIRLQKQGHFQIRQVLDLQVEHVETCEKSHRAQRYNIYSFC